MARSMLSLGIDSALAFSTALAREMFMPGSPPPSRAATVMARESLEKSLPLFASVLPFLCLIVAHLECPDMRTPPPCQRLAPAVAARPGSCLLYTSDAADEEDSVDLGGRRIIK